MANQIWKFGQQERLDSRRFGFISENTDGLASVGFLCCGIRSTKVETAVLFRVLDLGSSEAPACRPGMIR